MRSVAAISSAAQPLLVRQCWVFGVGVDLNVCASDSDYLPTIAFDTLYVRRGPLLSWFSIRKFWSIGEAHGDVSQQTRLLLRVDIFEIDDLDLQQNVKGR